MAGTAVALIVAGTGDTTEGEVADLLSDAYPQPDYQVDVIFPVDKELFSESVENVITWLNDEEGLYAFKTKGGTLSRKTSKFENVQTLEEVTDIFNAEDFKDWDEVQFLVAMPEGDEGPEYHLYVKMVEAAIAAGIPVKDLTRGLDDVQILEEEEVDAEPEPEPEKPARRTRRKKAEDAEEAPEAPSEDGLQEDLAQAAFAAEKAAGDPWAGAQALDSVRNRKFEALDAVVEAFARLRDLYAPSVGSVNFEGYFAAMNTRHEDDPKKDPEPPAEESDRPKRGRGRPRTNFAVSEIWDEDSETWIPRPEGRQKKGTKWRKVHKDTGDVLESGTA